MAPSTGFASGGVMCKLRALCFYSSLVQVESFVLRNPPERQAAKRYAVTQKTPINDQTIDNEIKK